METNINSFVSAEKQIINSIEELSGSYTPYVIFTDWVKMMAISIQNSCTIHNKLWDTRENSIEYAREHMLSLEDCLVR